MICPLCGKETDAERFCSLCGGDMAWARDNHLDAAALGEAGLGPGLHNMGSGIPGLRPELAKNPALHKAGLKNWLHSTQMPEWLKQEILAQEDKRK